VTSASWQCDACNSWTFKIREAMDGGKLLTIVCANCDVEVRKMYGVPYELPADNLGDDPWDCVEHGHKNDGGPCPGCCTSSDSDLWTQDSEGGWWFGALGPGALEPETTPATCNVVSLDSRRRT
jgi:hypothetical protein